MYTSTTLRATTSSASLSAAMPANASASTLMQLDSAELLQGQKTVSIVHNGATYRLQATKLGKLILTK